MKEIKMTFVIEEEVEQEFWEAITKAYEIPGVHLEAELQPLEERQIQL